MVLAKSVGLVVVLLATVAGVWWVAVTLIDRAKQPPAPPVVQQVPAQPQRQVGQQWQLDAPRQQFRLEPPDFVLENPDYHKTLLRYTAGGIFSVVAVVYCGSMLLGSLWIARTSSDRNQSPVGWLLYFWFCQTFLRSIPYAALSLIELFGAHGITAMMAIVACLSGELFGWSGLIAYRMAGKVRPQVSFSP